MRVRVSIAIALVMGALVICASFAHARELAVVETAASGESTASVGTTESGVPTPTVTATPTIGEPTAMSRRYAGKVIKGVDVKGHGKYVSIAIDDGPGPYRKAMLDLCRKYGFGISFYDVSSRDLASMIASTYAAGCEVQSHTQHHVDMYDFSAEAIRFNLVEGQKDFLRLEGTATPLPTFVRFPFNAITKNGLRQVRDAGLVYTGQHHMTRDYTGKSVAEILASYKQTPDGGIVLSHDFVKNGPEALEEYFEYCKSRGIKVVTVTELFKHGRPVTAFKRVVKREHRKVKGHSRWVKVSSWKYTYA